MTTENPLPLCRRAPWNKGRLIGQKRPLKPKDIAAASLVGPSQVGARIVRYRIKNPDRIKFRAQSYLAPIKIP